MSWMSRRFFSNLVMSAVLLVGVCAAHARLAIVTLNDGQQIEGDLVAQDESGVTIMVGDIRQVVPAADIRGIEYPRTISEQFTDRRAKVADDDRDGRVDIVRWLINEDALELASREIAAMLQVWPEDEQVLLLQRVVNARLEAQKPVDGADPDGGGDEPVLGDDDDDDDNDAAGPLDPDARVLLTPEQYNMIRIYEINLEEKPTVRLDRDLIDLMLKGYQDLEFMPKGQSQIRAYKSRANNESYKVLADLFRIAAQKPGAVSLYSKVTVVHDPPVMLEYRKSIQRPFIVNYCGDCHGEREAGAGNFMVFTKRGSDTETVYTNFFILNEHKVGTARMIDRDAPERSLLLQYGLPRDVAQFPHPEVDPKKTGKNWRPYFRTGLEDPKFSAYRKWIGSLWRPAPNYRIDYTPPVPGAAGDGDPAGAVESPPAPAPAP